MSVAEIRETIIEKVQGLSEEQLLQLNQFVDSINKPSPKEYDLLPYVEKIVAERGEVLKKLAQ